MGTPLNRALVGADEQVLRLGVGAAVRDHDLLQSRARVPRVDRPISLRDTRMVTRALGLCLVIAACLLALGPATASARARVHAEALAYDVSHASMSEDLTFQGDGGQACARAAVCDMTGHVHYGFDDVEFGDLQIVLIRAGHRATVTGSGSLSANGLTTATVSGGSGAPCTDKVVHTFDGFDVEGKPGRVRFVFHSPFNLTDYIDTFCAGPDNADLWHVHALPRFSVPTSRLRHHRVDLNLSSVRDFHVGPFTGQLSFSTTLSLRRVRAPKATNLLVSLIS